MIYDLKDWIKITDARTQLKTGKEYIIYDEKDNDVVRHILKFTSYNDPNPQSDKKSVYELYEHNHIMTESELNCGDYWFIEFKWPTQIIDIASEALFLEHTDLLEKILISINKRG